MAMYSSDRVTQRPGSLVGVSPRALRDQAPFKADQTLYLGKETAAHSGILAWRIPWPEEPGELQSVGSQ